VSASLVSPNALTSAQASNRPETRREPVAVGHHEDLGALARARDQAGERRDEIRVQARLRLVEHEEIRRAGRQERGREGHVSERAVRQLGGPQRAQEPRLAHRQLEQAVVHDDLDLGAAEGVGDRVAQSPLVADLDDGLDRRRQVPAVARQDRRARAHAPGSGGGVLVRPDVIVEAHAPQAFAQRQQLGGFPRVGGMGEHAVEGRQGRGAYLQGSGRVRDAHAGATTVGQERRPAQHSPGEDRLGLDLRIEAEGGAVRDRQPEIDRVAEIVAREAEPKRDGPLPDGPLDPRLATAHRPGDALRSRP
jgi:hypothetical protein